MKSCFFVMRDPVQMATNDFHKSSQPAQSSNCCQLPPKLPPKSQILRTPIETFLRRKAFWQPFDCGRLIQFGTTLEQRVHDVMSSLAKMKRIKLGQTFIRQRPRQKRNEIKFRRRASFGGEQLKIEMKFRRRSFGCSLSEIAHS